MKNGRLVLTSSTAVASAGVVRQSSLNPPLADQLLVIDGQVENSQILRNAVYPGITVLLLNPDEDGIHQITAALHQHPQVDHLYILAHGAPGCLFLGNSALSLETIATYASQLQAWFPKDAKRITQQTMPTLSLYACQVAVGDAGAELLEKLHRFTGATLYASTQKVGHTSLGGSWDLEAWTTQEQGIWRSLPPVPFKPERLAAYPHTLNLAGTPRPEGVSSSTSPNLITGGDFSGITAATLEGSFPFTSPTLPYRGFDTYPNDPQGGYTISNRSGSFGPVQVIGLPFTGDASRGVAAAPNYLYSNPNENRTGGSAFNNPVVWQQSISGITANTSYTFYGYFDNLIDLDFTGGQDPNNPLIRFFLSLDNGTTFNEFQPAAGGIGLTETGGTIPDPKGWRRIEFEDFLSTGAVAPSTVILRVVDSANSTFGDDFGMTALNLRAYQNIAITTANPTAVTEGAGAQAIFPVTANLNPDKATVFNYTIGGTALTYLAPGTPTTGTVTVPAGSTTANVSLPLINDAVNNNGGTLTLTLTKPGGVDNRAVLPVAPATIQVLDDDAPAGPTVTLSVTSNQMPESSVAGTTDPRFISEETVTVTLSQAATADVTVTLVPTGTATSGTDYTLTPLSLTIPTGQTTATATLRALADSVREPDETVIIDIGSVTGGSATENGVQQQTVTITSVGVIYGVDDSQTSEAGGTEPITAVLTAPPTADVTITFTSSNTAEGTVAPSTLVFTPSNWNILQTITVTGVDDLLDDGDIAYNVTAAVTSADADYNSNVNIPDVPIPLTNIDNDPVAVPTITFPATAPSATEGSPIPVVFTFSGPLSAPVTLTLNTLTVAPSGAPVATAGTDYTALPTTVTITPGSLNASNQFTLNIATVQDPIVEQDEAIPFQITAVSGATPSTTLPTTIEARILNDDTAPSVELVPSDSITGENGATGAFNLRLTQSPTDTVTVRLTISDNTEAQFTSNSAATLDVTIPAGTAAGTLFPIGVTGLNDTAVDGDIRYTISAAVVSGTANGTPSLNFDNVDDEPVPITLTVNPGTVAEGTPSTITASRAIRKINDVVVPLVIGAGSIATVGQDFTAPTTITIPGNTAVAPTTGSGTTPLATIDDTVFEGGAVGTPQTVILTVDPAATAVTGSGAPATVNITDNDAAPVVNLTIAPASVREGGTGTITATLDRASEVGPVVVNLTPSGTATPADYTIAPTTITIPVGSLTGTTTLTVTSDTTDDDNETLTLTPAPVTTAGNSPATAGTPASVTLRDLGPTETVVRLEITPTTPLTESPASTATITVRRTVGDPSLLTTPLTVTLAPNGGVAQVGTDFDLLDAGGTLLVGNAITIPAGAATATVTFRPITDNIDEGISELATIGIASTTPATNVTFGGTVNATITDDDPIPTVSLAVNPATVTEGTTTQITALLSNPSSQDIIVPLNVLGGTATDADYTLTPESITIAAGQLSGTVSLTAVDDTSFEGPETLILGLGALDTNRVTAGTPDQVDITLTDNDLPSLGLSVTPDRFSENGGTATVTATLSGASTLPVTFTITLGGTATLGADYTVPGQTISPGAVSFPVTIPAGQTSVSIGLAGVNDTLPEGDEPISLTVSNLTGATPAVTPLQVTTVLTDDEAGNNRPPETNAVNQELDPTGPVNITGLSGTDPDGTVRGFVIDTLPPTAQGSLFLGNPSAGGRPITAGQEIPANQIGQIFFVPASGFSDANFTYSAVDNLGLKDPTAGAVRLRRRANQLPQAPNPPVTNTLDPDRPARISNLAVPDPDGQTVSYTILTLPPATQGIVYLGNPNDPNNPGTPVRVGQVLTPDEVQRLFFESGEGFSATQFTYSATDNSGGTAAPIVVRLVSQDQQVCANLQGRGRRFTGKSRNDQIDGTARRDVLKGGDGNDRLRGGRSADTLDGGKGNDRIQGQDGVDKITGGSGRDTLSGGNCNDNINGGAGNDRMRGDRGRDLLAGAAGNDRIEGGTGYDRMNGGGGRDRILGQDGNDRLNGGGDRDLIRGMRDNDVIRGNAGNDSIFAGPGNDFSRGDAGNDSIQSGNGNDRAVGGNGNDKIEGGAGNDRLAGGSGRDILRASGGNDTLNGGSGEDKLFGGSGNDLLIGRLGEDLLVGGGGRDTYSFRDFGGAVDRINGFQSGTDVIDLRTIVRQAQLTNPVFNQVVKRQASEGGTIVRFDSNANRSGGLTDLVFVAGVQPNQLTASSFTLV